MKRLDRAIVNISVMVSFPNALVEHYNLISSDHRPILLCVGRKDKRQRKGFHFEDKWIDMEGFHGVVAEGWRRCGNMDHQIELQQRLQNVRKGLLQWAKGGAINYRRRIQSYVNQLEAVLRGPINEVAQLREKELL